MADRSVTRDNTDDNPRWVMETKLARRVRRIKEVWQAFRFLLRGGKFKVVLDFSRIDPRILGGTTIFINRDGRVVDLEHERRNGVAAASVKVSRLAGLDLAADDDPDGFRVKWGRAAREGKGVSHA